MPTQFLSHDGGQIAYDDTGSGPLVVCIPSMGDLRAEYRMLVSQLVPAGYRLVTMDVRGHGESSTIWDDFSVAGVGSDILALIRSLESGSAVIIGTSMAAGAAVWAAAEAPELVSGIIAIGPFVRGGGDWMTKALFKVVAARPWGVSFWMRYFKTLFPTRRPPDFEQYLADLQMNLSQPGRLEALHKMLVASKAASEERLGRVTQPVLVIMGSKDPDFNNKTYKNAETEAAWVAQAVSGHHVMIEGAGHYPHVEMPEETVRHILPFLQLVTQEAS